MMHPTVFILSTYSFVEPLHGGQIRISEIARAYQAAGFKVESLAIYEAEAYRPEQLGIRDIALNPQHVSAFWNGRFVRQIADFLSGQYACAPQGAWHEVQERLPAKIDVIHVEQPWLWMLAKKIQALPAYEHVKLVYGSQNIEAPLKREILEVSGFDNEMVAAIEQAIAHLERNAVKEADLVVAVSHADALQLRAWGASVLVLGENGIAPWSAPEGDLLVWRERLPVNRWPLYVSSAHLPNYQGFAASLANSLYSLARTNTKLVLAGGGGSFVRAEFAATQYPLLNNSRSMSLGVLSDVDLAAVKTLAHVFLLPICAGGGTNIKTAEALYSGAYVIASPFAFRGYEEFLDLPQVKIARRPMQFHQALLDCLSAPRISLDVVQRQRLDTLLWSERLKNIPKQVLQLING
jgi:glycosyltransferase involved in cell wall biosynthesis